MKKLLLLLLTTLLAFSLIACGNKDKKKEKESPKSNQENVISPKEIFVDIGDNTFPENTVVKVSEVKKGGSFDTASTALNSTAEKFMVYDIAATLNNTAVQPNGTIKVTFPIAKDYDLDRVAVIYISDDRKTEVIPSKVDKEKRTVIATLSHFSLYAVIESIAKDTTQEPTTETQMNNVANTTPDTTPSTTPNTAPSTTPNTTPSTTPSTAPSTTPSTTPSPTPESPKNVGDACSHTYKNATCTTPQTCSNCHATVGAALGHNYSNGTCTRCQAADPNFRYPVYVNGVGYNSETVITIDISLKTNDTELSVCPAYFMYKDEGGSLVPSEDLFNGLIDESEEFLELTDSHGGPIELGDNFTPCGYWTWMFCNADTPANLSSGKTIYRIKCKLPKEGSYTIKVQDGWTAEQNNNKYTSSLSLKIY